MKRKAWNPKPLVVTKMAGSKTRVLAKVVSTLFHHRAYQELVLTAHGPTAIEMAKRGRSLRQLAKATKLSPTYLSLVANGRQRVSLAALHALLGECEGVMR